jgi:phosphoglycerol transferase
VGEFIDKLKKGGYLSNTDVVVMGDHAAYSNTLDQPLKQAPQRSVYNRFYSSAPITKNRDHIYHYSFYPSILEMLGFDVGGGRLGIGFSGFHSAKAATSPLYTESNVDLKLTATADIYKWLWGEGR